MICVSVSYIVCYTIGPLARKSSKYKLKIGSVYTNVNVKHNLFNIRHLAGAISRFL